MIDVQVVLGQERKEWRQACLDSLAGHPVRVLSGRRIDGNTNAARAEVLKRCTSELVSWVDPDDIVLAGAFQKCLDAIGDRAGAYTWEEWIDSTGRVIAPARRNAGPLQAHHVVVVRRDIALAAVELVGDMEFGLEYAITALAERRGGLAEVTEAGYQWRLHADNSFKKRNVNDTPREVMRRIEGCYA